MDYHIKFDSTCGEDHIKKGIKNQDAVAFRKNENIGVIALADGAGSRKFAEQGAKTASEAVADYVFKHFHKLIQMEDHEIQNLLHSYVITNLLSFAEENGEKSIREFGSTLLFAATDGDRYLVGHIGDGSILGFRGNEFMVISYPENGPNQYNTILTTSFQAKKHFRIKRGNTASVEGIMLLSDGMLPFLFNSAYSRRFKESIQKAILKASTELHTDDASYIMINWRN